MATASYPADLKIAADYHADSEPDDFQCAARDMWLPQRFSILLLAVSGPHLCPTDQGKLAAPPCGWRGHGRSDEIAIPRIRVGVTKSVNLKRALFDMREPCVIENQTRRGPLPPMFSHEIKNPLASLCASALERAGRVRDPDLQKTALTWPMTMFAGI